MPYLGKCLMALVTPWGRLPLAPFAVMAFVVILFTLALQIQTTLMADTLPPYNVWSMSLVAMLWPAFCITSRRFHDSGKTAIVLIPLLIMTLAAHLSVFDNLQYADSDFVEERDALAWVERGRYLLQLAGVAAMSMALKQPADVGDNLFGHPFNVDEGSRAAFASKANAVTIPGPNSIVDETAQVVGLSSAHKKVAAAKPERRKVSRQDFLMLAQRGRITPAESARRRRDDFGRR
ncbi:MAG: DUF805 domain-containing protein [Hyphomicrobium sp.]|nr:DUF805 domain-containing protein [Hyphomicrobium sp.]